LYPAVGMRRDLLSGQKAVENRVGMAHPVRPSWQAFLNSEGA